MRKEESDSSTSWIFPSGAISGWCVTLFTFAWLVIVSLAILSGNNEAWSDESGNELGPVEQVAVSIFFLFLGFSFFVPSAWGLLQRDYRIAIDKHPTGNLTIEQIRWIFDDKRS